MQRGGNEISFGKKAEKPSVTRLSGRSLPDAAYAIGIITISTVLKTYRDLRELRNRDPTFYEIGTQ